MGEFSFGALTIDSTASSALFASLSSQGTSTQSPWATQRKKIFIRGPETWRDSGKVRVRCRNDDEDHGVHRGQHLSVPSPPHSTHNSSPRRPAHGLEGAEVASGHQMPRDQVENVNRKRFEDRGRRSRLRRKRKGFVNDEGALEARLSRSGRRRRGGAVHSERRKRAGSGEKRGVGVF